MSIREAEQAAARVRTELGVGPTAPIPDLLSLVENLAKVPVTLLDLPDEISGAFARHPERRFIFVNSRHYPVRRRFTLGHEFGHYTLDHPGAIDPRSNLDSPSTQVEKDANAFSAALLLPATGVEAWMAQHGTDDIDLEVVVRLAVQFKVSALTARYGLQRARFITRGSRKASELDEQIQTRREHRQLQRSLGLSDAADSLSEAAIPLGRVLFPREMVANALQGVVNHTVASDRAALALRRSEEDIHQAISQLETLASQDASEDVEADVTKASLFSPTVVSWG